ASTKFLLDGATDARPFSIGNPFAIAAIRDDLDVTVRQQDVDEHPVVMFGIPHVKPTKDLDRSVARRYVMPQCRTFERGLDGDATLTAVMLLAGAHRLSDGAECMRRKDLPTLEIGGENVTQQAREIHVTSSPRRRRH